MNGTLVTGATGFIGQHLVKALAASGHEVSCIVRRKTDRLTELGCRLFVGDVADSDTLRDVIASAKPSLVFHLAGLKKATSKRQLFEINEQGCGNLLEAVRRQANPPVVVLVSSLAAAGPSDLHRARRECDEPRPVSFYGKSKLAAERVAHNFGHHVPITVVRPPIVLGPGDKDGLEMFKCVARFGLHMVPSRKEMRVSWIYVGDLVQALLQAANSGKRLGGDNSAEGIYYSTSPETTSYTDLGKQLATAVGRRSVCVIRNPKWMVWMIAGMNEIGSRATGRLHILRLDKAREATAGCWTCEGLKLEQETGFDCRMSLQESLTATARWYRDEGWI